VDRRILVEAPDDGEDLRGGRVLREVVLLGVKAHLLAGLDLAPHVDLRGGIVAHPHHREPGRPPALLHEDLRRLGHLAADLRRDRLSVDDACAHAALVARGAKERATRMQSAPTGAWHPGRTDLPLLPMPAEILAEALRAMGQSVPWLLSATVAALALLGLERRRPAQAVAGAVVLSVGLGLGLAFAWRILWIADDAFISFRYARNFARGLGLVYNEGEWVEGYTNFLWTLLLGLASKLGLDIPLTALFGNLAAFAATVLLAALLPARLAPKHAVVPFAAIALALAKPFYTFAGSGLETMPIALLGLSAMALSLRP